MNLVCAKLLCAVAVPHEYETVAAVFSCAGNEFTAKGKTVLIPGWKEIDQRFRATLKADTEEEVLNALPELAEGQNFSVTTDILEHFTSPPKAYTEDTLLSAMERAGAEDMPEEAERKGLGTPATRAAILEKLVQMGFVQRNAVVDVHITLVVEHIEGAGYIDFQRRGNVLCLFFLLRPQ